jgi:heptose-I-phosphate ethanolaminephosphotransferase
MQMKLQKYTIFNNLQWQILLPLLVFVSCRFFFILFFEQSTNFQTFLEQFVYSLFFDGLLYAFILGIFQPVIGLKRALFIITSYFLLSSLIYFNHYKLYLTPPGTGAFAALFETTPQEAMEFTRLTDFWDILGTFTLSILPFISVFLIKKITIKSSQLFSTAVLFFIVSFLIHTPYLKAPKDSLMPMDYSHLHRDVKNIYHYFEEYYTLIQLRDKRKDLSFDATQKMPLNQTKQAHILVIGESLARNHMSVYGYHRKTTPRLDTATDILFYRNVISPTTQTRSSIVRMLTPAFGVSTDRFYEEGSILTAMMEAGFQTLWISNQGRYGISDTETSALANDAHASIFVNTDWNTKSLDEKVIAPLQKVLCHTFIRQSF